MPEYTMSAGTRFDVLNRHELEQTIQAWQLAAIKGARPTRFTGQGTIAAGAFSVDSTNLNNQLGPETGFCWVVRRLAVSGVTVTTEASGVYIGIADVLHLVTPNLTGLATCTGYLEYTKGALILGGGDRLVVASTGVIASTGTVTVSGAAIEVPIGLLHRAV